MKPDHVERIWMLIIGILAGIISTVLAQMLIAKYVSPNKHNTQIELASNDPRKELANIGVLWSDENFLEAISRGDARAVKLFLDGGFDPYIIVGGVQSLPIKLTINRTNPR